MTRVRLRHLLMSLAATPHEPMRLGGDATAGWFFIADHRRDGDHHVVVWNANGVVAFAFNHDDPTSQAQLPPAERTPEALLDGAPTALDDIVNKALWVVDRLATSALWIWNDASGMTCTNDDALDGYLSDDPAFVADWLNRVAVSDEQIRVARSLQDRLRAGSGALEPAERAMLTQPVEST